MINYVPISTYKTVKDRRRNKPHILSKMKDWKVR